MRVALVLVLLLLPAWLQAADADRAFLIGTWHIELELADGSKVISHKTLHANGTFAGYIDKNSKRYWNYGGEWSSSDGWLYYRYTASDLAKVQPGAVDKDKVLKVTATTLTIRAQDGGERTYVRVDK